MKELETSVKHFESSGYRKDDLDRLKQDAINKANEPPIERDDVETVVFPLHYFNGVNQLKEVISSLSTEFQTLIGDVRIMLAMKKRNSTV